MMLLFVTLFTLVNPILIPAGIRYRLGQTFKTDVSYVETTADLENNLEKSASTRIEVWKGGLKMIQENPLLGVGYNLFQPMIKYYWSGRRPIRACGRIWYGDVLKLAHRFGFIGPLGPTGFDADGVGVPGSPCGPSTRQCDRPPRGSRRQLGAPVRGSPF